MSDLFDHLKKFQQECLEAASCPSDGIPGGTPSKGWPILSDALAVHHEQRAEAIADALHKGVPTDFTPDGRPILTDRAHRKRYLKAYRFHDNRGGYGD